MRTQRLIAYAFAACLASLLAGSAMAQNVGGNTNSALKGTYQLNTNANCATSDAGFTDFVAGGSGQTNPISFTGVITYDGKGHATSTDHGIALNNGPYGPGASAGLTFEETCDWTYAVNPDLSFSREGSCTGTETGGPNIGATSTLTGIKFVGKIGVGGSGLITNALEPVEQTFVGSGGFFVKRLCGGVGTEMRINRQ